VLADLQGMTDHDKHERIMDTFVPTPGQVDKLGDLPQINLDEVAPVVNPPVKSLVDEVKEWDENCPGCELCTPQVSSDPANYVLTNNGEANASWKEPGLPLWAKLGIFAVIAVSLVLIFSAVFSCPK
jgi:hypothetical protein